MADDRGDRDGDDVEVEIEIDVERDGDEFGPDRDRRHSTDSSGSNRPTDRSDARRTNARRTNARSDHLDLESERTPERHLEDELGRIDVLTTPEGYVEGRVTGLTSIDATTVRLEVTLPHDERVEFDLEKPIPWSEEFLLARLVEDVGYDAASVGHLVGESVYLTRTDVGPEAEEDDEEWLSASIRAAGDAMLASLSPTLAAYFESEARGPQWRLVDPLERPRSDEGGLSDATVAAGAAGTILLGALVAVVGAIVGATGGLVVSSSALVAALPGLLLALIGVYVLAVARE